MWMLWMQVPRGSARCQDAWWGGVVMCLRQCARAVAIVFLSTLRRFLSKDPLCLLCAGVVKGYVVHVGNVLHQVNPAQSQPQRTYFTMLDINALFLVYSLR